MFHRPAHCAFPGHPCPLRRQLRPSSVFWWCAKRWGRRWCRRLWWPGVGCHWGKSWPVGQGMLRLSPSLPKTWLRFPAKYLLICLFYIQKSNANIDEECFCFAFGLQLDLWTAAFGLDSHVLYAKLDSRIFEFSINATFCIWKLTKLTILRTIGKNIYFAYIHTENGFCRIHGRRFDHFGWRKGGSWRQNSGPVFIYHFTHNCEQINQCAHFANDAICWKGEFAFFGGGSELLPWPMISLTEFITAILSSGHNCWPKRIISAERNCESKAHSCWP